MSNVVPVSVPVGSASRYAREIDLSDLNNAHSIGILLVPPGSRVLDIGAADGSVARALTERGCEVVAIEIDPIAARAAERHCREVICADVETLDLDQALHGRTFDVVLMLDVLEHLHRPQALLERVSTVTAGHGVVIASIPNVTHASVRLELLHGRFPRTDTGLLDRTHLHFFDRPAVEELFAGARLQIHDVVRVTREINQTELPVELESESPDVLRIATADTDSETYQFVLVTSPHLASDCAARSMLAGKLQERVHSIEKGWRSVEQYVRKLEHTIAERERQLAECDGRIEAQQTHIADLQGVTTALNRDVADRSALLAAQQAKTEDLERVVRDLTTAVERAEENAARDRREACERLRTFQQVEAGLQSEIAGLQSDIARSQQDRAKQEHLAAEQLLELRMALAQAERDTLDARDVASQTRQAVNDRDAQIATLVGERHTDAQRHRKQQAESDRVQAFLRRDVEIKDAYIAALRERERDAERALAHREQALAERDARVSALEADAFRLRDTEAAFLRVPTTPRFWLVDRLNAALKRSPVAHRVLRSAFVRLTRLERSA